MLKYTVTIVIIVLLKEGYVTGTDCPDRFLAYQGSCYLFARNEVVNFVTAENYCRQHGAHLVRPTSRRQLQFLKDYMGGLKVESFWLGITDEVTEGVWLYYGTDKVINVTDWSPGEPDSHNGHNEDCGAFYAPLQFRWVDAECTAKLETVCQINRSQDFEVVG